MGETTVKDQKLKKNILRLHLDTFASVSKFSPHLKETENGKLWKECHSTVYKRKVIGTYPQNSEQNITKNEVFYIWS